MKKGTIKKLAEKGFGFIKPENGEDVFFHASALTNGAKFNELREGQAVQYDDEKGPKGPKATKVVMS